MILNCGQKFVGRTVFLVPSLPIDDNWESFARA